MDSDNFRFEPGIVNYWDLNDLDIDRPLIEQLSLLKEDLAQVTYPSGVIVDIGWYPEFSRDGSFRVMVIRDGDWLSPIFDKTSETIAALKIAVREAVTVAMSMR